MSTTSRTSTKTGGNCAPGCVVWLNDVVRDPDYQILKGVRDPLVHRKLGRFIYLNIGGPPPGTDRLGLAVPEAPRQTGEMSSRQVIELSRDTAARHVVALLQAAQAGHVS